MKIGHVYIEGQIGSQYDGNEIVSKGVELIDIVSQVEALDSDTEQVHFHIDSPGGFVEVGNLISEYIKGLGDKAVTIAESMCASIATKIHLSAPLQNRWIQSNCQYMIHNPFLAGVSGDAETLEKMSKDVAKIEADLEKMYAKATGLDKTTISGLMKAETYLTADQCVQMKFASKIVEPTALKAVAMIGATNSNQMNKDNTLMNRLMAAKSVIGGSANKHAMALLNREAKAVMIETDNGTLETPFADVAVGDPVMIDGEPAPDGTYVIASGEVEVFLEGMVGEGTVIEVADGAITAIQTADGGDGGDGGDGAENKTVEELQEKIEALEAEKQEAIEAKETAEATAEEAVKTVEEISSKFKSPEAMAHFRDKGAGKGGGTEARAEITKGSLKERRATYGKK